MSLRRGACPSLARPMQTGDGLLARINPVEGRLSAGALAGLARAARRFGNGIVEITARGSLQVRGLCRDGAEALAHEVAALGIALRTGVPVEVGPLAGLDAREIADPRPLAERIAGGCAALGLAGRLGPKVSVTVDGGGVLGLSGVPADVKLEAVARDGWLVDVGGPAADLRRLGCFGAAEAASITLAILEAVAGQGKAARARDLCDAALAAIAGRAPTAASSLSTSRPPVGRLPLANAGWAWGFALAYGQIEGAALQAFAAALGEGRALRLARGRGLIVLDVDEGEEARLLAAARKAGLVTDARDRRLSIAVCAGRPACASAHLATRRLADALVARRPALLDGSFTLHLSGCGKHCARPPGPCVTLTGTAGGATLHAAGMPIPSELEVQLRALLEEQARQAP
ncbi:precorrin-3B synthase [Chelativorans intermedius]|nr:precorrin-3B synthase [Chelativorans intermedius]MCT8997090.1 precorrin-3B synthase [Chelativorans intermedius]